METTTQNNGDAQGANTVPERKPSKLYAMKSFKASSQKIIDLKMVNEKDAKELKRINNNLLNAYLLDDGKQETE